MKILDLVLKGKWYDMIASGVKTEEYREIKPYWQKRIMGCYSACNCEKTKCAKMFKTDIKICFDKLYVNPFSHVRFRRGYTSTSMLFPIKEITIGYGNPEWGAPTDREVFIIKLGNKEESV